MADGFPVPFGPAKRQRVEEIAAAWETYDAGTEAAKEVAGYSEDGAEEEAIADRHADLVNEIAAIPTTTLPGLALKAEVAAHVADAGGDTLLERIEKDLAVAWELEDMTAGMVALSIVRDLLRLASTESAHG